MSRKVKAKSKLKTLIGERLRMLRVERGMSQIATAHALGPSPSYVQQLERNRQPLTASDFLKVQKALSIDLLPSAEMAKDETHSKTSLTDPSSDRGHNKVCRFCTNRRMLEKSSAPCPARLWAAYRLRARPPSGVAARTAAALSCARPRSLSIRSVPKPPA